MTRFGLILIFVLTLVKISSQFNLDEINAEFQKFNESFRNAHATNLRVLDDFFEKLRSAIKPIPEVIKLSGAVYVIITRLDRIFIPYIETLKSCDDLKLRNSSSFVEFNQFYFTAVDVSDCKDKFERNLAIVRGEFEKSKSKYEDTVKDFADAVNTTLVSRGI